MPKLTKQEQLKQIETKMWRLFREKLEQEKSTM